MKKLLFLTFFILSDTFAEWLTVIPANWSIANAFKTWDFSFDIIAEYIFWLIDKILIVWWIVAMVFIIVGWMQYVTSFWKEQKDAMKVITNAIYWLIISAFAWVIVELLIKLVVA